MAEVAFAQADVETQVDVAIALEEFTVGGTARARPVIGLEADRQVRLLVEVDDAAVRIEFPAAVVGMNGLEAGALALGEIIVGAADLSLVDTSFQLPAVAQPAEEI